MSFVEAWKCGGFIMWVLLGMSVAMLSMIIYMACVMRTGAIAPKRLVDDAIDAVAGGDFASARRICEMRNCAFASVALAGLDSIRSTGEKPVPSAVADAVASEGGRIADSMQLQAQLLLDASAIAPMIGLLGTTLGMLTAFGSVASNAVAAAKPVMLAQGVSQAIITTIFGLIVAIPCLFFYALFRRRATRLAGVLERAASGFVAAITTRSAE